MLLCEALQSLGVVESSGLGTVPLLGLRFSRAGEDIAKQTPFLTTIVSYSFVAEGGKGITGN